MAEVKFTDADITEFFSNIITATGAFSVDSGPDKYIRQVTDEEAVLKTLVDSDGKEHPLALYGSHSPDAIIINPLAEGESGKKKTTWWYASCNAVLAATVFKILNSILTEAVNAPAVNTKKNDKSKVNLSILPYLKGVDADAKTLKELASIVGKNLTDFFGIFYNKNEKCSKLQCTVFNEARKKAHSSVRTKTWKNLETILTTLIGSPDEYTATATIIGCPMFETYTVVYTKILGKLKEAAKVVGIDIKNHEALESSCKYIAQYFARAKWCVSVEPATPAPATASVPWKTSGVPAPVVPTPAFVPGAGGAPISIPTPPLVTSSLPQVAPVQSSLPQISIQQQQSMSMASQQPMPMPQPMPQSMPAVGYVQVQTPPLFGGFYTGPVTSMIR